MLSRSLRFLTDRSMRPVHLDLTERAVMIENLIMCYHVICASEALLRQAIERTLAMSGEAFDVELAAYLSRHLDEETNHARWMADDLATVDVIAPATAPLRHVAEAVGAQFYWIHYGRPEALLSYMAVLEWHSLPIEAVVQLEHRHGKDLLRTVRIHAENDPAHAADLDKMLDAVPQKLTGVVIDNGLRTAELMSDALRHVAMRAIERERGG